MSIRPEGTFGRLRYALGGDRPSQTAPLARSCVRSWRRTTVRDNTRAEWYFNVGSPATKATGS